MQVSKWGNSLAIRLPKSIVSALNLKEGDVLDIEAAGDSEFVVRLDPRKDVALIRIRELRRPFPEGFKFEREGEHER